MFFVLRLTSTRRLHNMPANRLIKERSPYLRQHAHNPVDWYPWGPEAFALAKQRNVPIFLSIGYSTCHWCHVMERESFSNEEIARLMNEKFVNIKVDREERPDVDSQYMTYVQMRTGGGGWPLSVFLTKELKPFFGGTYFPPHDNRGMLGLDRILRVIAGEWDKNREQIVSSSEAITSAISKVLERSEHNLIAPSTSHQLEWIKRAFSYFDNHFDEEYGGFGIQPKFPTPVNLLFLLRLAQFVDGLTNNRALSDLCSDPTEWNKIKERCRDMVRITLEAIWKGGIHDHVGLGIHRYAVDRQWNVPHFEKMLYDQAQLLSAYAIADKEFESSSIVFKESVKDISSYVSNNLASDNGAFNCAEDADSYPTEEVAEKEEGAFATWTEDQLREALSEDEIGVFIRFYGNGPVLRIMSTVEDTARSAGISEEECHRILRASLTKLASIRATRPKPHRDEKILTEWNALLISAFCDSGDGFRAKQIAEYIRKNLYINGTLMRHEGQDAFATDFIFLIKALLDLHSITIDMDYLHWAVELQGSLHDGFWDTNRGGYYTARRNASDIIFNIKDTSDRAEPSANTVAAENLLRLELLTGDQTYRNVYGQLINFMRPSMDEMPHSSPILLTAILFELSLPSKITVYPTIKEELLQKLRNELFFSVVTVDPNLEPGTLQVCKGNICHPPISFDNDVVGKIKGYK